MNLIFKRNLFIIFASFSIVAFMGLALWQMQRKDQKDRLQSEMQSQLILPSIDFHTRAQEDNVFYRKYFFKGNFTKKNYYIYGSNFSSQKNGYFVATPLLLEGGDQILVIKGWSQYPDSIVQDDFEVFEGIIIRNASNKYAPSPHLPKNIYYSFDLNQIPSNINLERRYLVISTKEMMGLKRLNISKFMNMQNRHTEYIITWFTLAFFTFIMSMIYLKKK